MLRTILCAAALGSLALAATADTIYVDDDAPNDPGPGDPTISDPLEDGSAKHPFDAIQKAIDASFDGDVIEVREGTYTGPGNRAMNYGGRDITVRGADMLLTVVDLELTPDGFVFDTAADPGGVLANLTIRNGFNETGGAALRCTGVSPRIEDCLFEANESTSEFAVTDVYGGAVRLEQSSAWFVRCRFEANVILESMRGYGGAVYALNGSPSFFACAFTQNEVWGDTWGRGGAIAVEDSTALVVSCTFDENEALFAEYLRGGAIASVNSALTVRDSQFRNNIVKWCCYGIGGAIASDGAPFEILRSRFEGNGISANPCTGVSRSRGGAVWGWNGVIEDCRFESNFSHALGLELEDSRGGAACVNNTIRRCVFIDNEAEWGGALAPPVSFEDPDPPPGWIVDSLFVANHGIVDKYGHAGRGGAIGIEAGSIVNCTLVGNVVDDGLFGVPEGGGIDGMEDTVASNCIVRGNTPDQFVGSMSIEHSNVEGGAIGAGNIDVDPAFVDRPNDDYRLAPGSPCIDAGSTLVELDELDLAGAPRRIDDPDTPDTGEGPAPLVDMGAYEYQPVDVTCSADLDGSGAVDFGDLLQVLTNWGDCVACPSDLNGDGRVSFADLLLVLANWGDC